MILRVLPRSYFLSGSYITVFKFRKVFLVEFSSTCSCSSRKDGDDLEKELKKLAEVVGKDVDSALKKGETGIDKNFMNFKAQSERYVYNRTVFSWKVAAATLGIGVSCLAALLYIRKLRMEERERHMKYLAGKARIGGEWELVNTEGKLEGSEQLKGNWLLIYFGFTHCPDICPDEIEKMAKVVEILDSKPAKDKISIKPIFISVDPERDTPARVKEYCAEFSPKIQGYTGSQEQVNKVTKTFRVYYSKGPKTGRNADDYIVDHTVITYLIDPDGNFHDYYNRNRTAEEIADIIELKVFKYHAKNRKKILGF
ncbi:SCO1/SenC [Dictyocaulus viviparus]|uniref:SCO1/SenC n=1 Tax=Dictyocaulus viviparus TaxID=29172 RepID=A0A0D8XFE3_DICVI|nr:SCO1/SenC [Dictyocaulus viviparus]